MKCIAVAVGGGSTVYDGATRRIVGTPREWAPVVDDGPVRRIRLEFLTPLRMRTEGRYNASPDFVAISQALTITLETGADGLSLPRAFRVGSGDAFAGRIDRTLRRDAEEIPFLP